jgi:hypothetical protein
MNLCADLQGLSGSKSLSQYSSILAIRLLPVGTILLNEVSQYTYVQNLTYNLNFQMSQKLHSDSTEAGSTLVCLVSLRHISRC